MSRYDAATAEYQREAAERGPDAPETEKALAKFERATANMVSLSLRVVACRYLPFFF